MSILIAPIGEKTQHVTTWLKEVSSETQKLWLIYSKKGKHNFPKIAQELEDKISDVFLQIKIKKVTIDDAWSIGPTLDVIRDIIDEEEKADNLIVRRDFVINITGGTNAMAAAAILAATFYGTRANYIKEPQKSDKAGTKYVEELPIQPIGIAKLNNSHRQMLHLVSESHYEISSKKVLESDQIRPNARKKIRKLIDAADNRRIEGAIKSTDLAKKWEKVEKSRGKVPKTASLRSKVKSVMDKLIKAGYVEKIPGIQEWRIVNLDEQIIRGPISKYDVIDNPKFSPKIEIVTMENEVYYQITAAGKRKSKDRLLFDDNLA